MRGVPPVQALRARRPVATAAAADLVVPASRRLEQEEPAPGIETLAAEAGLSRAHFQRVFKRVVGLTPMQCWVAPLRELAGERFPIRSVLVVRATGWCGRARRGDGVGTFEPLRRRDDEKSTSKVVTGGLGHGRSE